MRVTLIDYTGSGHPDKWYAANLLIFTKNTRLKMGPDGLETISRLDARKKREELDYMANTIRSSWEFVDYTFLLEDVTRAFTHQLVRTRHASYAQQTQQVLRIDASSVERPKRFIEDESLRILWDETVAEVADAYDAMLNAGATVEEARGILPTNVHTNIVVKMNLRTVSEVFGARIGPRNLGEYSEVARRMRDLILGVHPWADVFLDSDRLRYMEELDRILVRFRDAMPGAEEERREASTRALKLVDQLRRTG